MTADAIRTARVRPASWLWRIWPDLAGPWLVFAALTVEAGDGALGFAIVCWWAFLLVRFAFAEDSRPLTLLFVALSLYGTSAWIAAARFGVIYPPFPEDATIAEGTRLSLLATVLAFLVLRALPVDLSTRWLRGRTSALLDRVGEAGTTRLLLIAGGLVVLGAHDWLRVREIGASVIVAAERRAFAGELLTASNHNVQIVGIGASMLLAAALLAKRRRPEIVALLLAALILFWSPSLFAGSRKSPLLVLVPVLLMVAYGGRRLRARRLLVAIGGIAAIALFLIPIAKTGCADHALIEFIYPQYLLFVAIEDELPLEYGYGRGASLMLPAVLRPAPVRDLGSSFADLGVTNVGIGAHPLGEAYLASPRRGLARGVGDGARGSRAARAVGGRSLVRPRRRRAPGAVGAL